MSFFTEIISGWPGLLFVAILWMFIRRINNHNLHTPWLFTCCLFFKQCADFLHTPYTVKAKGQLFDSPTGAGLPSAFYPPGFIPDVKSNRPDFFAFLSGSASKAGFLLGILFVFSFSSLHAASISSSSKGGNWSDPSSWLGGMVPGNGDEVIITAGAKVMINSEVTLSSLSVSGVLEYESAAARTLTVTGIVTINSGGVFRSAQSGTIKNHRLIVHGSIINNGAIDFSSNGNETGAEIIFTGAGNAIFNCSDAPLTNLRSINGLVLDKGTSGASVLSFTPGNNFRVLSDGSSNAPGFLSIVNGTFNIIGSKSFSNPVFNAAGSFTIPATGGFWLGNQNATVTAMDGTLTNLGDLKMTNGTLQVGRLAEHSLKNRANGQFKMTGGTIIVAGGLELDGGNSSITGGTLELVTRTKTASAPALSVSAQARLEMYGDPLITLTFPNSKNLPASDIEVLGGSGFKSIKGGTIQLGTAATPAGSTFLVSSAQVLDNLAVFDECSIRVMNSSGFDLQNTPVDSLPLIVFDPTAPELVAPAKITQKCGNPIPPVFRSLQEFIVAGGAASDNCTLLSASFKLSGQVQSSAGCPYTITRTYEVKDISGNASTVEHVIVVEGEGPQPETVAEQIKEELLSLKSAMAGTITSTASGGDWNLGSSWFGGVVPSAGDNVVIVPGATVTVNSAASCDNITIDAGATLKFNGTNTLQVNGNLLNNGTISSVSATGKILLYGNWTNNGTYNGDTNGIVEFTGANPASIDGGTSTIFKNFIISKGAVTNILQVNSDITLGGDITFTSGKMQINIGADVTCTHNAGFIIKDIAGLYINGGTFTTGAFSIDNEGLFQIDSGTMTIGTSLGNGILIKSTGLFDINGGTVNIAGRLEVSGGTADISGGTINLNTIGHNSSTKATLDLSLASDFIMSGGTINFLKPNGTGNLDVLIENGVGGNKSFTGGVLNFGTGTADTYRITSKIPFPNITAATNTNLVLKTLVSTIGNYSFPLVDGLGNAIPASVNLNSAGTFTSASIQIETFGTDHPNNASATNFLKRYWTVTTSGITSPVYNITAAYADPADISGTDTEIALGSYVGGSSPWVKYGNANAAANTLSASGIIASSFVFAGITSDPPTVTASASPTAICLGASSNLTATPDGDAPFTYSWVSNPAGFTSASATPNVTPASTTVYTVTVTDGNGFTASATATVTVLPDNTVSPASSSPAPCINSLMTNITHTTTGATGIGAATGLPSGVTAAWASNTITISGTPTASGTFNYSIPLTGGCGTINATGTITVTPNNTVSAASSTPTLCINTALTAITHTTTGATGIGAATGLPTGVTAAWSSNTITISGIPTVSGTFNYSIPLTGGCGTLTATGSITVTPANTVSAASSTPTICLGVPVAAINHTTSGATGIGAVSGLPNGVTAAWAANTITISGTPIVTGTFNYSIPLTGGCGLVNATGTITVNPAPAVSITANPGNTICSGATVTFTTSVTNAGTNPTYQWQSSMDGTTWTNISGATNSAFSSSTLLNAQRIRVVVTADPTYCSSIAISSPYTMTVNPPVIPTVAILESANPVCAGTTVNFSTIVKEGGSAPTYQWQLNGVNISGATSPSYSSSTLANGDQVRVFVTSNATCAINNPAGSNTITMTVNPLVTPSVSIVANKTTICPGEAVNFTATPVNGGTNPVYQWKVNSTIVGSNNPVFTSASLNNGDVVSVRMTSNAPCASPTVASGNTITMTVNPGTPAIPGAIAGTNPTCPSLSQIYSVVNDPTVTTYTWTVPAGWTITSGDGTNSITVTTGAAGQNGNITVTAGNSCGTSLARTLAVTVNPGTPATPGAIIGTTPVCPTISGITYSITAVPNATSYTWTLPSGWTGTSTTNSINVTSGSAGQNGNITVTASNSCGTSAASTFPVIVNPGIPAQPGAITGTTPVCPAIPGLTYSIAAVPDATYYTWTLPSGWTGTSTTNVITVTSGSAGQSGNITVTATNSCGTSLARSFAVTVGSGIPATPGAITGAVNQCINSSGLTYSVSVVPNATYYTWTLPSGWTGTSTANSITVATTGTATSGNISVIAGNTCGTSATSTLAVTVNSAAPATPAIPTGPVSVCPAANGLIYSVPAVANATSYNWTLPSPGWTIVSGAGTNSITVNVGSSAAISPPARNVSVTAQNACGTSAPSTLPVTVGTFAFVNAGTDIFLCAGSTSVNYSASVGGAISGDNDVQWTSSSGAQKQRFTNNGTRATGTYDFIAADIAAGIVTLTITSSDPAGTCVAVSDQVVVRILANPTASISGTSTICAGSSSSITFTATPNTTVTYRVNSGANQTIGIGASGTATLNTGSLSTNTTYSLVLVEYSTAPACSQTASGSALITVNPAATANAGADQAICASGSVTLAGQVGGAASSGIWSGGAGTFSPTNTTLNAVYTPTAGEILAGSVNLILTTNDPDGAGPCSAATDFMVLTINPVATVNAGPAQTICAGSSATMAGSFGGSATAATWSGGGGSFSPSNGALNAVYTPTAAEVLAGLATLTLTTDDPIGPCGPVSATVVITINPLATVNAGADQTVCSTSPVTLAGIVGGGASTGTWSGGLGSFSPDNTTLNAVYTPSASEIADGFVNLTLTTNDPAGPCTAVSDQVRININQAATVNAGLDQEICQGSFIVMSGTIGGAATSGIWSGGTGTFSPNNTTLNATYTPGAAETGLVTLTLTTNDPAGTCTPVSDQVVITIGPKPIVTVSPDQMICSNATATVTGTFSGGATSASWSTSGFGTFDNINSATAVYTPGNGDIFNGSVTLTYTTDDPPGICGPASASLILTVKKVILITTQPVNTGVCATYPADLIVTAVGDNLTYQWYKGVALGGTPVVNSSNISGAQAATLHFNNATSADAGSYYLVISSANACSSETSNTVTLNVDQEITVTTQIQSNSVCVGDPVTFSIVAEPGGVLTYQWRKDGVNIPGETGNSLNLGNVTLANAGNYDVLIQGLAGYTCSDAKSATATLTVNTDATIALTSATGTNAQNGCLNQPITNITYAVGGGATNASATGLPAGVTGVYNSGAFTISGIPTATGTFNYTITTTGNCLQTSTTGTITINPSPTIVLGPVLNYCPGVTSFALPYTSTTNSPVSYSISAGTPAVSGFVPVTDAPLGASPINITLPAAVPAGTYQFAISVKSANNCSSASQTFTVTLEDVTPPVKPTLPNLVAQCSIFLVAPTTTDNCSGTVTGTTTAPSTYTTSGVSTIEWTFTDAAGNVTTATQVITINDTTAPTWVLFPADIPALECGSSLNTTPAATGSPTATDNCSAVVIGYTESITAGTCSSRYTIKRTWKATDASGNSITRDQLINVVDTTPPVISCTSFTNFDANVVPASELHTGVTATDNCSAPGAITFELISEEYYGLDVSAGWCPSSLERVYVARDACGNVSSPCTQTYTFINNPNCQACIDDPNTIEDNVPFFPVIFTQPDQSWTSESVIRNGICCFAEGPPPPRCISFNVYLHPDAVGLIFTIPTGAIPGGALYYHVDCGPPQKVGEVLCLSGGRFYTITFCEPGNNPNTYSIQSISGAVTTDDIVTRADANCIKDITVTGLQTGTVSWTVKYPENSSNLLSYLSCTDCLNPVFTPDENTPPTIIYTVCGQLTGTYVCDGVPIMDCADLTVTTLPPIHISFDVNLDNICVDDIPAIDATVTPGGFAYDYKWYDSSGNLIGTGATWTPTAEGNYSLIVTENQSGVSCNSSTYSFTITFDYIGPGTLNVPPPLEIECNTANAETTIAAWLATATAADANISSIPVSNDYSAFTHACGGTRTVTFWASDNCGNTTTGTSQIRIIDTTPPVITIQASNQTVECDGSGNLAALNAWLATQGGAVATDACGGTLTWTNNYSALSDLCGTTGVATVTFTVSDACTNSSTTVATFTIVDTQAPTISCPPTATGNTDANECYSTTVVLGTATGTDNCSAVTVANNAPAQFPAGTTTVTWTATDACGNTATCTQLVIVSDATQPPTLTCPASVEETIAADQCSKTGVTPGLPTIWDNCPNPVITYSMSGATTGSGNGTVSNTTFNVGVTSVTYTVTDLGGNTVSCSFTVWIKRLDIPAAVITCPANPASVIAGIGTCSATVTLASPQINDPCNSIVSVVHNSPYGTSATDASGIYPSGTTTVTWTITDTSGNVETCTQIVTVIDTQAPVFISCPANQEQLIIDGGCNLSNVTVPNPTFADNCGIESLTWLMTGATTNTSSSTGINYVTGQTFNVGVTVVTYTVTDISGLTATCTFTVWMKNLNAPQFSSTCPADVTVSADGGLCSATVTVPAPGITNPCNETYTVINDFNNTSNASGVYPVGVTTVTWTITDASGTVKTCTQVVTVNDTQFPTLACPADAVDQITNGGCNLVSAAVGRPSFGDNCGIESLTYVLAGATTGSSPATGINYADAVAYNVGITSVTYTVTDLNGLTRSCTHTVWIKSLNAPQFSSTCPADVSVSASGAQCSATVTVPAPGITNPCNEVYTVFNNSPYKTSDTDASGTYPVGTTTVTWTITDASGSIKTCTQIVTVIDDQDPVLSCPSDAVDQITNGGCNLVSTTVGRPTVTDCSVYDLTYTLSGATTGSSPATGINYADGVTYNVGITTVTYTATDAFGNISTCTHTVWIKNLNAPQFSSTCPADVSVSASGAQCSATVTVPAPGITNPCNELYTVFNNSPYKTSNTDASGTYPVGTTTVTWTITDASGSIKTCTQIVTVIDDQDPVLSCPSDAVDQITNGGCNLVSTTVGRPTVTDCSVYDLTYTLSGATTGSSPATGINYADGVTYNVGITTVTYTATDAFGNISTCTHTVWIKNLNAPRLSVVCPVSPVTATSSPTTCEAYVTVPAPVITNPCNEVYTVFNNSPYKTSDTDASGTYPVGTTTVTWTVTDASGNLTTCTQYVVVNDLPPTISCPADITEQADFELPYKDQVTVPHPTYGDNCPDPVLTWIMSGVTVGASTNTTGESFVPSPSRFNVGVTSITYTVTDSNGNVASCTFNVTILAKPEITCHIDISGNTDTGTCTYNTNPGVPTLDSGVQPITWDWRIDQPDGSTISGTFLGSVSNPGPPDIGSHDFQLGTSTITWRATNVSGYDECAQLVTVEDKEPPTFTVPMTLTDCVESIMEAVYDPATIDITPPRPEYFIFAAGNTALDLPVLGDNCCATESLTIHWTIDFTPVPDPANQPGGTLSPTSISGTGQPSQYGSNINFPGDGVTFLNVTHIITYWVEDCHGNRSGTQTQNIVVTPRPQLIKQNQ